MLKNKLTALKGVLKLFAQYIFTMLLKTKTDRKLLLKAILCP
ncbi:MAG: hypothetical protein V4642_11355 [Bacteroidota bacterium]